MCYRAPSEARHNNWLSNLRDRTTVALERRKREDNDDNETALYPDINRVDVVHWYCKENARTHHTLPYDLIHDKKGPQAVLRRGLPFHVGIRFKDRNFDIKKDRVILNFEFGANPSIQKGTLSVIQVENDKFTHTKDDWDIKIDNGSAGRDLILQVFVPASVPVGCWCMKVKCGLQDHHADKSMYQYTVESEAYILFNPFCKEDMVYMENEAELEEYVMNDKGKVFVAANRDAWGSPWAFGQFEDVVLPVAVYILDRITDTERANPVPVVRAISSGINSNENEGILEAKWPKHGTIETYSDGVSPMKWVSSVSIIEKYVENGFQPVKYGQCWIFSALVTTICRALGIPCRPVTNVVSAHDTNSSLTVDRFFTADGEELYYGPGGVRDSVCNFHVWNDVWMSRTDLPKGYSGWQAIDATPQEKSKGKWQCGPASLEAIRRGDIGLGFDAPYIFAALNADILYWKEDKSAPEGWKSTKTNKYHIGRKILTRKPGKYDDCGNADLEDIITQYKNQENSRAECLAIHNSIRGIRNAPIQDCGKKECQEDVTFDLCEIDHVKIGDNFVVKLIVTNNSDEPRSVMAAIGTKSIYCTGAAYETIKKLQSRFVLQPKQTKEIILNIAYAEYWSKLVEGCMVKIHVIAHVEETDQMFADEDDFMIEKPMLEIKVCEELKTNELCVVVLSFKNPLDMPLTDCEVTVVGPGLMRDKHIKIPIPISAEGLFSCQIQFKPRIHGLQRKIIALFNAKQLFDILGTKTVTVKK